MSLSSVGSSSHQSELSDRMDLDTPLITSIITSAQEGSINQSKSQDKAIDPTVKSATDNMGLGGPLRFHSEFL